MGEIKRDSSIALLLEASACSVGITKFLRIMRNPKITLKESNLKVNQSINFIILFYYFRMFGCSL